MHSHVMNTVNPVGGQEKPDRKREEKRLESHINIKNNGKIENLDFRMETGRKYGNIRS